MIFQKEHIEMIQNGLYSILTDGNGDPTAIAKTQTRRVHRGKYREGRSYAIQPCRTCKGIESYRIVMDRIWEEQIMPPFDIRNNPSYSIISEADAWAEGGYTPEEFEKLFREINSNWNGIIRYGFKFHAIEARK